MYTLDTNAIIYLINDDERAAPIVRDVLADPTVPVYVSTITETELFRYSRLSDEEAKKIEELLGIAIILVVDSRIARLAGRIGGMYGLKTADSIIAATALFTRSTLLTRNTRDFKKIPFFSLQEI